MNNIAVFIDLNKTNFTFNMFHDIMDKLDGRGQIVHGKLYNFSSTKHKDYLETVNKLALSTAPQSDETANKRNKDVLDIRQVVDILDFVNSKTNVDMIFIITGNGNVVPLLKSLKMKNLYIIGTYGFDDKANRDMCNENYNYNLTTIPVKKEVKKEEPTKKSAKKAAVKKAVAKKPAKAKTSTAKTKSSATKKATAKKTAATKKPVAKTKATTKKVAGTVKKTATKKAAVKKPAKAKDATTKTKAKATTPKKAIAKVKQTKSTSPKVKRLVVEIETPIENVVVEKPVTVKAKAKKPTVKKTVAKKIVEQKPVEQKEIIDESVAKPVETINANNEEQFFVKTLEEFAKRTSGLNFEFNEDIDKKTQLLNDIEKFVRDQKAIQYEKDDFNAEIMSVLRELGNLATDIRATMDLEDDSDGDEELNY